jgi:hypothetical protein
MTWVPWIMLGIAAALLVESRARTVREVLGLRPPSRLVRMTPVLVLCVLGALVAVAVAQPVLERPTTRHIRSDAEALFVFDTTRSMLASAGPGAPTRFARAQQAGLEMRRALSDVPVGLASMSDRVLPHLFPTADTVAFDVALKRTLGVEQPPPRDRQAGRATQFESLEGTASDNLFSPRPAKRLLVVFTDGETEPFDTARLHSLFKAAAIKPVFVQFWSGAERLYSNGSPEADYLPDPAARRNLRALAGALGGRAFPEQDVASAIEAARSALGQGPTVAAKLEVRRTGLAPYLLLFAFAPLVLLLWRPRPTLPVLVFRRTARAAMARSSGG